MFRPASSSTGRGRWPWAHVGACRPGNPASVEKYLATKFGARLEEARTATAELPYYGKSMPPKLTSFCFVSPIAPHPLGRPRILDAARQPFGQAEPADMGPDTDAIGPKMRTYNPDASWAVVTD